MALVPLLRRCARLALPAAALGAVLLSGAAAAADNGKARPAGGKSGDSILTPAQLRDCVTQKERLQKNTDAALKVKGEIAAEKAEIDRSGTALAEEATTLDRSSTEAVDAYNAKIDERDKRIDAYQARISAYNKDAETVLAQKEAYEKTCENRRYDERDLNDLRKKK
jgi:hypothetical protein